MPRVGGTTAIANGQLTRPLALQPDSGMHPTHFQTALIFVQASGRVVPGVRPRYIFTLLREYVWKFYWQKVHEHFNFLPLAFLITDLDHVLGEVPWPNFIKGSVEPFACMLEPPALDARIVAQSATFTLCSDKTRSFDQFLSDAGLSSTLTRYIIRASTVDHIRDQLDLCSVNERRLFPDLGGVSSEMRRYYSTSARTDVDI